MRLFEILYLIGLFMTLLLGGRLSTRLSAALAALTGLLLAAHLQFETPRWQMIPLYLVGAILLGLALTGRLARARGKLALGLLVLLSAALPFLVPVNSLPAPSGPYGVGTLTFDWVDPDRPEIYTDDPADTRRIMVQVWYPANLGRGATRALYHPQIDAVQAPLADFIGIPPWLLSHLGVVQTHAFLAAPAAGAEQALPERFPVLVFSHGWRGMRGQNTYQMEELASHGYVIFSADHTFGAVTTAFSDGQVVGYNPNALPEGVSVEAYDAAARRLGQSWSGDIRFIFDQAARLNDGQIASPLAGRLDLSKMGVLGHSTGGGAAIEACWLDDRCQAGLVMDAWMIPYDRQIPVDGLRQPFLFMFSETWSANRNPPLVNALLENMHADAHSLTLSGTNHTSFTDMPLFVPLLARIQTGSLFALTPQERVNIYSLAFFDEYLKGKGSPLLQPQSTPLPGVVFKTTRR